MFLPHPRVKVSIVGSLRNREVACSASDRQGSNFEFCVWRTVSSQSSHHPQEVLLAQFSLYVHKGGLKPDSFHFILCGHYCRTKTTSGNCSLESDRLYRCLSLAAAITAVQRQTAVTAYFSSKQLQLCVFALQTLCLCSRGRSARVIIGDSGSGACRDHETAALYRDTSTTPRQQMRQVAARGHTPNHTRKPLTTTRHARHRDTLLQDSLTGWRDGSLAGAGKTLLWWSILSHQVLWFTRTGLSTNRSTWRVLVKNIRNPYLNGLF